MGARIFEQTEPAATGHFIEFRNVSKAFDDHLVLDDVSFFVDHGETCVIMGRSGVGKSVTLSHLMGFLKPDSGRVIVAREDITDYPEDELSRIPNSRDPWALLRTVPRLSVDQAMGVMLEAHTQGVATVIVCPKETAEFYREGLEQHGLTSAIEPI